MDLSLSIKQHNIAVGLLLGDASIQTQNKGKTYRLKFYQGNIHKNYLFHLYDVYKNWVLSPPKQYIRIGKNNKTYISWGFQTISHKNFNCLADIILNDLNRKQIKKDMILNHMTPEGLAYWFMDDGGKSCYNKKYYYKGFVYNTQGFSIEEVEMAALEMSEKFQLDTQLSFNRHYPILKIKASSHDKFVDLIKDYIAPSMEYKIYNNKF